MVIRNEPVFKNGDPQGAINTMIIRKDTLIQIDNPKGVNYKNNNNNNNAI